MGDTFTGQCDPKSRISNLRIVGHGVSPVSIFSYRLNGLQNPSPPRFDSSPRACLKNVKITKRTHFEFRISPCPSRAYTNSAAAESKKRTHFWTIAALCYLRFLLFNPFRRFCRRRIGRVAPSPTESRLKNIFPCCNPFSKIRVHS